MKKPMYERRICYVDGDKGRTLWNGKRTGTGEGLFYPRRVRVSDAREPTPEKAVEKVLQVIKSESWAKCGEPACALKQSDFEAGLERLARSAGMTARVVNGKVRVRRAKK